MQNQIVSFTAPNPYQSDLAKIQEQRQLAQLLQQQSMQAPERFSYKGIEARTSPLTGLAKALQGFAAAKMQSDARKEEQALGERYRADQASDMQTLIEALKPRESKPAEVIPGGEVGAGGEGGLAIQPAVAGKPADIFDSAIFGQDVLKTPEMRNLAFQKYLSQSATKAPIKVGAGDILLDPNTLQPKFTAPEKADYGQPIREQLADGTIVTVAYNKEGNRKVIETGGAKPAVSADTEARLKQERDLSDRAFNQLSENQRRQLQNEAARIGISAEQLYYDTGVRLGLVQPRGAAFGGAPQPASAVPNPSVNVTQPASGPSANARVLQSPRMMAEALKNAPERENTLRDEFNALTKDFRTVQDAHTKIRGVANTGAGDMSLLYSYVKLLDPGSVVRESEFATAAASGSFGERVQGAMQRVISGQRLPPDLRNDFLREADNLYKAQLDGAKRIQQNYTDIAKRMNLDPRNVITDYTSPAGTALPPMSALKEGHETAFENGQVWTLKNGKPVQVK